MKCPYCGYDESKVTDSRPSDDRIRRRRECMSCKARFTTFELIEKPLLMVEKRSGSYEPFDREKLIKGIFSAIKKRPVSIDRVSSIADHVENYFANELKSVAKLKDIDPISYIRFASVYEDFTDIESFISVISELDKNQDPSAP